MYLSLANAMKYVSALRRMCTHCYFVSRGRFDGVRCWAHPRHNQMQRGAYKKAPEKIGYGLKK